MADVHHVFRSVLLTRLIHVLLWHIFIQTLVLQFIAAVDFKEEFLFWVVTWSKNLVNPRIFVIIFFQFLLSAVFVIIECSQYLKVNSCGAVSRFRYLCQKLSPNNLVWLFVYVLRGILSMIVFFVVLKDYFVSTNTLTTDNVTETIIILLSNAATINFLFFLYDFVYQKSFRYFSLVQNRKNVILPTIFVTLKDVSVKSLYYCIIFVSFYLLKGHSLSAFMCHLFSVKCSISYSAIFSPFVLYCLWLLNAFLLFNNLVLKLLFDVFLTSRIDFPIHCDLGNEPEAFTLKDALSTTNVPVIQYLGYYDLNIVSQFDNAKRQQIFSLSYPGGHPYVWRDISQQAIKLIADTNEQLERIASIKPKQIENADKYNGADYAYVGMRSLSSKQFLYERTIQPERIEYSFIYKITNVLKTFRIIAYFVEEMTEKQLECSLQHYQSLSLACYSLANLAVASKLEDKYGVVQQDLPLIINTLSRLYVTLNKLVVVVNRRSNSSVLQIKKYLVNVVRSSLYKLSIEFGPYVKDIALSAEDEKLFNSFILFKN